MIFALIAPKILWIIIIVVSVLLVAAITLLAILISAGRQAASIAGSFIKGILNR